MLFKKPVRSLLFALTRRGAVRRAEACAVPNEAVARYASSVLHARKAVVIGRGISDTFFTRPQTEVTFDACFAGRLSSNKGIPLLLDAWREVVDARPDASLGLAGAGDETLAMKSLSEKFGLHGNVHFLGYLSDPESLHLLYLSSKLFVFPSKREGFARAISEAMASGIPCIVSDLPELRATYGNYAMYFEPDDKKALAMAILELLANAEKRERIGRSGSNFVRGYSWRRSARILADTFTAK